MDFLLCNHSIFIKIRVFNPTQCYYIFHSSICTVPVVLIISLIIIFLVQVQSRINFQIFFFFEHAVCWILVPRPRIEPRPPAVEVRSLNHWTTKDFLEAFFSSILIFLKNISQLSKVLQVILAWCFLRTRSKSGAFLAGASQMRLCSS